jgi:hypothetical protein
VNRRLAIGVFAMRTIEQGEEVCIK